MNKAAILIAAACAALAAGTALFMQRKQRGHSSIGRMLRKEVSNERNRNNRAVQAVRQ